MRYLLVLFLLVSFTANAEVYLLVDKSTKEVKSMSKRNDAVLKEGWEKVILEGELSDYDIQHHPKYYLYKNGKFILNIRKLSEDELKIEEAKEMTQEYELIQEKMRELAIEELKKEGKELKHFK